MNSTNASAEVQNQKPLSPEEFDQAFVIFDSFITQHRERQKPAGPYVLSLSFNWNRPLPDTFLSRFKNCGYQVFSYSKLKSFPTEKTFFIINGEKYLAHMINIKSITKTGYGRSMTVVEAGTIVIGNEFEATLIRRFWKWRVEKVEITLFID